MIGGKLEELGKDPMNIEVIIDDPVPDTPTRGKVSLRDEERVFVSIDEPTVEAGRDTPPTMDDTHEGSSTSEPEGGETTARGFEEDSDGDELHRCQMELERTHQALQLEQERTLSLEEELHREQERTRTLEEQHASALEEVRTMRDGLEMARGKVRDTWRMHCAQLVKWDAEMADGDAEIARLRARVAELDRAGREGPLVVPRAVEGTATTDTEMTPELLAGVATSVWSSTPVITVPDPAPVSGTVRVPTSIPVVTTPPVVVPAPVSALTVTTPPAVPASIPVVNTPPVKIPVSVSMSMTTPHPVTPSTITPATVLAAVMTPLPLSTTVTPSTTVMTPPPAILSTSVRTDATRSMVEISQHAPITSSDVKASDSGAGPPRRGKAPPIDNYTGEDQRIRFDDWLPV